MKRIQLFGSGMTGYSPYISRQKRLNCFFELREDGDKQQWVVHGTPGMTAIIALPSQPIRGWHVVGSVLYVVCGLLLCSVQTNGAVTTLGQLALNSSGNVSMADNGVQLVIVDGNAGYIYTLVTGTYKQSALNAAGSFGAIADGNFPNGTSSITFLDGRIIVVKINTRQFYVSELYDATNWTNIQSLPTYGTKDNNSDNLVAVNSLGGILTLFGSASTEFWQDAGLTPLPFARVTGATRNVGLAAQYSIAWVGDMTFFLSQYLSGGDIEITMLQGFTMNRVSTSDLEDIINNFTIWSDAIGFGYILEGHKMYQITFPSAGRSFLYDATTNIWSDLQSGVGLTGRHLANFGITFNHFIYVSDSTSGNIYMYDDEQFTDNGALIKRQLTTRHIQQDGNVFSVDQVYLDMETGTATQYGAGSNPQISLQVSKDGGHTFGNEHWTSLGTVGQYKSPRPQWSRIGASRDFVFQFTMTEPIKFAVVGGAVVVRQQEGKA